MKKQRAFVGAAIAAAVSGVAPFSFAADNFWIGTTTDWNTPSNWSLGRVPVKVDDANFDDAIINSTTLFPIINASLAATPRDIITGQGAGNAGRVDQTAGTAATGGGNWFYVGRDAGTGTYNLADTSGTGGTLTHFATGSGSINVNARAYIGGTEFGATGATGTLNINTTGTLAISNDLAVGTDGSTGVMNMDAGSVTTGGWNFIGKGANVPGGNGTLNMSGGTITNGGGRTYIGFAGAPANNSTGKMVMTAGTYNNPGDYFCVGANNIASAQASSLSMTGSSTMNTSLFIVGGSPNNNAGDPGSVGKGLVTINSDAAVLNTGELWLAQNPGSNGVLTLNAGAVNSSNWFVVGRSGGTGTLNMNGGTLTKTGGGNFIVGSLGGTGTVNQTGGAINTVNGGDTLMGEGTSTALWDISGGSLTTNGLSISWSGGVNEFRVRGTGAVTADHINLGEGNNNGSGIVNQSGGTVKANQWLAVGLGATQQAKYNLSGGTVNAGGIEAGADGPGLIAISGTGVLNVSGNTEVPSRNGAGTLSVAGNGVLNTSNVLIGGRDNNTVGSGVVDQSGGLVKASGDVVVQRPNVGTGRYNLSGGTLSVDGALNTTLGTFSFTGGRLTRSNTGVINVTGDLHVGNKAAGLKLDTDKTFAVSGLFDVTPGVTFDVTGLVIPKHTGAGFETGSYPLGTDNSILGTFDPSTTSVLGLNNMPNATFISETAGESHAYSNSQSVYWVQESAGQVSLQYSVTAPEPGTLGVLTLSGLTLLARRRRRK